MEGLDELLFSGVTLAAISVHVVATLNFPIQVGSRMQCLRRRRRMRVKTLLEFQMHNVAVPFLSADVDAPAITDVPELT